MNISASHLPETNEIIVRFGAHATAALSVDDVEQLHRVVQKARAAQAGGAVVPQVSLDESGLSEMAKRVLTSVYTYKERTDGRNPSQRELKVKVGLKSHDSLTPYLDELEMSGWIRRPDKRKARAYDFGGSWQRPGGRPFAVAQAQMSLSTK